MGFFSRVEKQRYLGVDIGLSGIKIVEFLNERGRARLVTYAYVDIPADLASASSEDLDGIAALIRRMTKNAKCMTMRAISSLPMASIFSSVISVPANNEKELKDGITLQAKKLIPVPLEDVILDSKPIDVVETSPGKKTHRVLLTGAPKTLVNRTNEIFVKAGLELLSLETDTFATIRSLVGKDRSTIMIVDIGSQRTNITVVEKGVPFLTHSIASGGIAITHMIAKTLGISESQADALKRDIRGLQAVAPTGDISPILQTLLKPILDEMRYSFGLFQSQSEGATKKIDKIILTGGSALLPRLPEFVTQLMNANAYLGDPWARVIYPHALRPVLDEIGPRFTVAIGCAMRDMD